MKQFNSKFKLIALMAILLMPTLSTSQVVVNEYSAANFDLFFYNIGWEEEYDDWIELYNPSGTDVDISGFYLSDDNTEPDKWAFPGGTVVPANGYLVVLCSDLDGYQYGYYHTSFKLTQTTEEWVVFADPSGAILEEYQFVQPNQRNHSFGRVTDGGGEWKIFTEASPGTSNNGNATGSAYAEDPDYDQPPGYHPGPIQLIITAEEADSEIYYTLDGSTPTNGSTLYTGPINIDETVVVRAIAYNPDPKKLPSFIETTTFFIGDDSHTTYVMSVAGDDLDGGWFEGITTLELFDENGEEIDEVVGETNEHGNDSNAYGQRGFDYITRDQLGYDDDIAHEIFPISDRNNFQRLIMKAAANDNYPWQPGAHIRDAYVQSLSQVGNLELDERSHQSCIVYVNGEYWGVYEMREKVDDLDYTEYYYDQPRGFVDFIKTWGGTWEEYGSEDDWVDLVDFITSNDMTVDANYDYVTSQYEVLSLIDYFILNSYVVCMDWLNWNTAWWRGTHPDGTAKKWRYALWDMDASFGHYINYTGIPDTSPFADPCDPEGMGDVGGQGHVPVLNALMNNEDFFALYVNRYADLSNSLFSCEFMNAHLDSLLAIIEPEMERQCTRWGGSVAGWQGEVQELRDFIDERCADEVISGMEDCYDLEAFVLTIIIEGIGEVQVNSVDLNEGDTPWDGDYFADIPIDLSAFTDQGVFLNWEVTEGNLVIPDPSNPDQTIIISGDVTIVAHFATDLEPQSVMFDAIPQDGGQIIVNGLIQNPLPSTIDLDAISNHEIIASPNEWFVFDHWESLNHTINPDVNSDTASVFVLTTDTIIAVFQELEHYSLTIDVEPAGFGAVILNGAEIPSYPFTDEYAGGEAFNAEAVSAGEWFEFTHWELNNNVINPDEFSSTVNFALNANDTLVAHFEEIPHFPVTVQVDPIYEGGRVFIDDTYTVDAVLTQEYEEGSTHKLKAKANEYFTFREWKSNHHQADPDMNADLVEFTFTESDTIIAVFEPVPYSFYVPNSFTPNSDGTNDYFKPVGMAVEPESYRMQIFNRWGELVFETTNLDEAWDGSNNRGEYYVNDEIYFYRIRLKSAHETEEKEITGHILVFR